jgi:hypothetical protein
MNKMKKQVVIIVFGLMSIAHGLTAAPFKEESRDMVSGAVRTKYFEALENYKPFGGGPVDYVIETPTDMMDVQGGQVYTYLFVQLDPKVKKDILDLMKTYEDRNIDDALINTVEQKNKVAAKVLRDFKKLNATVQAVILSLDDEDDVE